VSAVPYDLVPEYPIQETADSKGGVTYAAANGNPVKNMGKQVLVVETERQQVRRMTLMAAKVKKVLLSVDRMVECGHTVVMSREGSRIINDATGETTPIHRKGRVFTIKLKVLEPQPALPIANVNEDKIYNDKENECKNCRGCNKKKGKSELCSSAYDSGFQRQA